MGKINKRIENPHCHHAYPLCDECGERHSPNDKDACIECLKLMIWSLVEEGKEIIGQVKEAPKLGTSSDDPSIDETIRCGDLQKVIDEAEGQE